MRSKAIQGCEPYMVTDNGEVVNPKTGVRLVGSLKKSGYREVCLCTKQGRKYRMVHRLVAEAFCAKRENAPEVNHKDGDKSNNRAENLEWVSRSENLEHAYNTGLRTNDVTPRAVVATSMTTGKRMVFGSIYKAARTLGISQGNICMCCRGRRPYANGYKWEYEGGTEE